VNHKANQFLIPNFSFLIGKFIPPYLLPLKAPSFLAQRGSNPFQHSVRSAFAQLHREKIYISI